MTIGSFSELPVGSPYHQSSMAERNCWSASDIHALVSFQGVAANGVPIERMMEKERPFIAMLGTLIPREAVKSIYGKPPSSGCLRTEKSVSRGLSARIHPDTQEPTETLRPVRRRALKEFPSCSYNRWKFPDHVKSRMAFKSRASRMEAILRATDLEDDVWHLWVEWETGSGKANANSGQAAVGDRDSDSVHFGTTKFIVDTGCGFNLIAERLVKRCRRYG